MPELRVIHYKGLPMTDGLCCLYWACRSGRLSRLVASVSNRPFWAWSREHRAHNP